MKKFEIFFSTLPACINIIFIWITFVFIFQIVDDVDANLFLLAKSLREQKKDNFSLEAVKGA